MNRLNTFKNHLLVGATRFIDVRGFWLRNEMEAMQRLPKYKNPLNLVPYGCKIFSQNDEDGIIIEIFRRIGTRNKIFVEFGCGNGLENNTLSLLYQDWKGLWIEQSANHVRKIKKCLPSTIHSGQLTVVESFINTENINTLISTHINEQNIDLLSIDIDGNDYTIWGAIDCIRPRVVIIEYNAKFAPPIRYCMRYAPNHQWMYTDNGGASLKFLEENAAKKGYALVGCSLAGANAFFIQQNLVEGQFEKPFIAEKHYEPSRAYLAKIKSGHPASFKTLENRIKHHVGSDLIQTN